MPPQCSIERSTPFSTTTVPDYKTRPRAGVYTRFYNNGRSHEVLGKVSPSVIFFAYLTSSDPLAPAGFSSFPFRPLDVEPNPLSDCLKTIFL